MSFFDDPDEPTRAAPRPRPARPRRASAGGGRGGGSRGGVGGPSAEQARVRQLVAIGVSILLVILVVVGISSCLDSRKEKALKDYNQQVGAIIQDSDQQVGAPFFQLLSTAANASPQDLQVQVNQLRLQAANDSKRARGLDVPDEMAHAQADLTLVLNLREEALRKVAELIPSALVKTRANAQTAETAVTGIAGQMQALLASDVIYSQRVAPYILQALDASSIHGQTIQTGRFLPSIGWLDTDQVAQKLGSIRAAGGTGANAKPAPGIHGHSLDSVTIGGVTLQPSPTNNRVPAGSGLAFDVKLTNGGDNNENDVDVTVKITGSGKPITLTKTLATTTAHSPAEAQISLDTAPPIGKAVIVSVAVAKVPGETNTDNNRQSYTVEFVR